MSNKCVVCALDNEHVSLISLFGTTIVGNEAITFMLFSFNHVLLLQIGCSHWEPLTYPDLSFKHLKLCMWHHHICCFRFSGLTADNFKNVDTCLKDVQAILLDMFQEDTVLIGHSLNSDLIALKVVLLRIETFFVRLIHIW